jgi:hypothetical protein
MALSGISLNGATSAGPGAAIVFDTPRRNISMQVSFTGDSAPNLYLEGSIDGVNFTELAFWGTSPAPSGSIVGSSETVVVMARANITVVADGSAVTAAIAAE